MLIASIWLASTAAFGVQAAPPCTAIPLDLSGPRPALMMAMNGRAPMKALFDTGAMATSVDLGRARALGLSNAGPLKPPFSDHGLTGYQTRLKRVSIGGMAIGDFDAPAMPTMVPGIVATVGPSVFGQRYVTLDFAKSELRVCPRNAANRPLGAGEPYTAPPVILPAIAVVAGTTRVAAHIDTGSPLGLFFPMRYAASFTLSEQLKKVGMARSHFGEQPIYQSRIAGPVKVGAVTLDSPQVHFSDVVPEPNVGVALLRQMNITIDPVAKRAWTTVLRGIAPTKS